MRTARVVEEPEGGLEALVARMCRGDQASLASLYDATHALVHGTCLRILHDAAAAEEATMDAYLQAWRSAGSYSPERGSVVSWLVVMARSRAIDVARSRRKRPLDRAPEAEPEEATAPGLLPDDEADRSLTGLRVRRALERLPRDQRQALAAAFFDGLTHSEIAEALKQPLGTIKTRIRTGLQRLRQELDAAGMEPLA